MKLLLHADIPKLGFFGDVVEVMDGYARNYLLPQKLAVKPTETNIKLIKEKCLRKQEERQLAHERLVNTARKVDGAEVLIKALANDIGHLFGSVSEEGVAKALRERGFEVQTKHVLLDGHIRTLGAHEVKLRFTEDIGAKVTINVVRPEGEADESQPEHDTDASEQN